MTRWEVVAPVFRRQHAWYNQSKTVYDEHILTAFPGFRRRRAVMQLPQGAASRCVRRLNSDDRRRNDRLSVADLVLPRPLKREFPGSNPGVGGLTRASASSRFK